MHFARRLRAWTLDHPISASCCSYAFICSSSFYLPWASVSCQRPHAHGRVKPHSYSRLWETKLRSRSKNGRTHHNPSVLASRSRTISTYFLTFACFLFLYYHSPPAHSPLLTCLHLGFVPGSQQAEIKAGHDMCLCFSHGMDRG